MRVPERIQKFIDQKNVLLIVGISISIVVVITTLLAVVYTQDKPKQDIINVVISRLAIPSTIMGVISMMLAIWWAKSGQNKYVVIYGVFVFILLLVFFTNIYISLYYSVESDLESQDQSTTITILGYIFTILGMTLILTSIVFLLVESAYSDTTNLTSNFDDYSKSFGDMFEEKNNTQFPLPKVPLKRMIDSKIEQINEFNNNYNSAGPEKVCEVIKNLKILLPLSIEGKEFNKDQSKIINKGYLNISKKIKDYTGMELPCEGKYSHEMYNDIEELINKYKFIKKLISK